MGVGWSVSKGLAGRLHVGRERRRNQGGLLGPQFEKWGIYCDVISQVGGDLSGEQVSEENRESLSGHINLRCL